MKDFFRTFLCSMDLNISKNIFQMNLFSSNFMKNIHFLNIAPTSPPTT